MKKCPFCAESIQQDAIKCHYCGEFLEPKWIEGSGQRLSPGQLAACYQRLPDNRKLAFWNMLEPEAQRQLTEAFSLTGSAVQECPYCGEMIPREATVCRYCHRDLSPQSTSTSDLKSRLEEILRVDLGDVPRRVWTFARRHRHPLTIALGLFLTGSLLAYIDYRESRGTSNSLQPQRMGQELIETEKTAEPVAFKDRQEPTGLGQRTPLALQNWRWHANNVGFVITEGIVRNVSPTTLDGVVVAVELFGTDRELLSSDRALISENPLPPGRSSPFRVLTRPEVTPVSAEIDFETVLGEKIAWFQE